MNAPAEKKAGRVYRLRHSLWDLGFLPEEPTESAGEKASLWFCLSGFCYFFLYYRSEAGQKLSWYAMVLGLIVFTRMFPDLHRRIRLPLWGRLLAAVNGLGVMGAGVRLSMDYLHAAGGTVYLAQRLGLSPSLLAAGISGLFGLCGLWFLYVLIARLYTALVPVLTRLFAGTPRWERRALCLLTAALAVYAALAFSHSEAFYATAHNYDVIYTADSAYLVRGNTWLNLTFVENDLRQPLFAVFSAPFLGAAYALTQLVPSGNWMGPWIMNLPQLGLLVLGFYMLASLLTASAGPGRLAVTVSLCALYPSLLFSLMMEQYIVAVFWLLLFVYMTVEELPGRGSVLVAAAGSLMTSAAMLPMLWRKKGPRPVRRAVLQSLAAAGLGAFLVVAFLRTDVVLALGADVERLSGYAGGNVDMVDRLRQYLVFVAGCFAAPPAGETAALGFPSWQLLPAEGISPVGLFAVLWCAVGAVVGFRERIVGISGWWCLFSALLLAGMGWGTAENGLILYGLYFSWAFYVLLRQPVVALLRRLGRSHWQTAADAVGAVMLLALNIPGVSRLLEFAFSTYPV